MGSQGQKRNAVPPKKWPSPVREWPAIWRSPVAAVQGPGSYGTPRQVIIGPQENERALSIPKPRNSPCLDNNFQTCCSLQIGSIFLLSHPGLFHRGCPSAPLSFQMSFCRTPHILQNYHSRWVYHHGLVSDNQMVSVWGLPRTLTTTWYQLR